VFSWENVEGADYYRFNLYKGAGDEILLYSNAELKENNVELALDNLDEGAYYWTVQAFTNPGEDTTRRTGLTAGSQFELHRNGVPHAKGAGTSAGTVAPVPARQTTPVPAVPVPAKQTASVPASQTTANQAAAKQTAVSLPRAGGRAPADNFVMDGAFFRGKEFISFTWNAVTGANRYTFTLFKEEAGKRRQILARETREPAYSLQAGDFPLLSRGNFIWRVEAIRRGDGGSLLQHGETGENRFTVDIPAVQRSRLQDMGTMYGND
jgi:hypothetical protein